MSSEGSQKQQAIGTHSAQADEFVAGYEEGARDAYGTCFAYSRKRLDEWLDRYLPKAAQGLRLLDIGCGTGHHMVDLRRRGFEVSGVDGSDAMLARARAANPGVDLRLADVESVPFESASFDQVLCIEVLRYLPNPSRCLAEMARVLRPGGAVLVTALPLFNLNGYYIVNRLAGWRAIAGLVPLRQFFTTSTLLRRQFQEAGFAQVTVHGVYFGPVNWIERLARPVLRPALRAWEPLDRRLSDRPLLRDLSNMLLVHAVKGSAR